MNKIPVKTTEADEAFDIPSMRALSDDQYSAYVSSELFWFDHHEVLRSSLGGYPIATTARQARLLIKYLEGIEARMKAAEA